MSTKLQQYTEMADCAKTQLTSGVQDWIAFLTTASRTYKYPFSDLLMIHAQRPQVTACAEYDFWKKRMRRYIQPRSKGIALIRTRSSRPSLRYVFDVEDTGGNHESADVCLWRYRDEHREIVSAQLEETFGVPGDKGVPEQLICIALQLATAYWEEQRGNVISSAKGSALDGLDELNVNIEFSNSAAVSIAYIVLSRCELDMAGMFTQEDFQYISHFNTPTAAAILGTAVTDCARSVLRQVEWAVKSCNAKSA